MFSTPPKKQTMVKTRRTKRQEELKSEATIAPQIPPEQEPTTSVKSDSNLEPKAESIKQPSSRKTGTSASSMTAQKKRLELEIAKQKARIQMELLDKQLAADLAAVDEKYSPQASQCDSQGDGKDIEEWLERSQHELERQRANENGSSKGPVLPSSYNDGTNGPVQQLTNALKELVATHTTTSHDTRLLSRLSTPRELPIFSGDPMEWLSFKHAIEESTSICSYSEKENLWRLRKCLRGPAKEAVSALLISTTSTKAIISTLELLFGNPDIIISKIFNDLKKLHPLPQEYGKEIVMFSVKIKNYVECVRELKRQEYLQGVSLVNIVLNKLPTVLMSKWVDYSYPLIIEGRKFKLEILSDFLNEEAIKVSTCSVNLINPRWDSKRYNSDTYKGETILLEHEKKQSDYKCNFCKNSKHSLPDCKKFKRSLRKDRWSFVKRVGICYKCLSARHDRRTCPASPCDVDDCGQSHHRLLHYVPSSRTNEIVQPQPTESETSGQSEIVNYVNTNCAVLLKVVPVYVRGPNGTFSANALLDDGSTVSVMCASLAARAGLCGLKQTMRVRGTWDCTELLCEVELLEFTLSNKLGEKHKICIRSVNELNLPKQNYLKLVNADNYPYLNKVKDYLCTEQCKPQILIGQDNHHLISPLETITRKASEPYATRTAMGWCVHGRVLRPSAISSTLHSSCFISEDRTTDSGEEDDLRSLHESIKRYFSNDLLGATHKPRQNSADQRAWSHLEQTASLTDGMWQVGLPWKDHNIVMPNSLPTAMARLRGVEIKIRKNKQYAIRYHERIQHLIKNNYAEPISNGSTVRTWYLPHFGVDNPNKGKLRLVFDAAAKTNGMSLNDFLLKGPDLLVSLFGIMLRFREHKVAVTADIKDMFLRVKIRKEDRDAFRFIFRGDPTKPYDDNMLQEPIQSYVMTSLIFGANCSPFIAQFIKNKNAERFAPTMPAATTAIYNQHYMDDYIDSLPDECTTILLIKEIMHIHKQGNFELRNWNSNSQTILNSLDKELLGDAAVKFKMGEQYDGHRTLGLIWHAADDILSFDVSLRRLPEDLLNGKKRPTKREILRVVMSIFDVYGILSPFTINGKIILQEIWRLNIGWDEVINDKIYTKWLKWITLLRTLRDIKLPRHYPAASIRVSEMEDEITTSRSYLASTQPATCDATLVADKCVLNSSVIGTIEHNCLGGYRNLEMHIFCDASSTAYCSVAYWKWIDNESYTRIAFIASKCRVAGTKTTTIPRLELQAAVLAARLADLITSEHRIKPEKRIFWSDSTTVLHWIRNDARNYNIFIGNRLGVIDELTQIKEWRYVPTKDNVADIATRETYDYILPNEWLHGPAFLYKDCDEWPRDVAAPENSNLQLESLTVIQMEDENLPVPEPAKFSSWLRLLKSTGYVLTFVDRGVESINRSRKNGLLHYNIHDDLLERAERLILRYSQAQSFREEVALLKNAKNLPKTSKLLTLTPYLDEHGVLRAGGRIDAAPNVPSEMKRPAILDGKNYIARLIIRYYHINAAHGNQETVVNEIKQRYWIIRLRPTVKNVVSKCMLCRLKKFKPEMPRMGDLPEGRMTHHRRPFTHCGVDLFGPMEVTVGRRHERRYGVLFTCLTVRAVHIETVPTLTTDSFIMALRRMAARRGWPQRMYSDNGTNFRGAHAELKRSIQELDQENLKNEAINHGMSWTFIPPASPHWGGAWERLIRSVKTALRVVLKERAPREEVLITLLSEIENIINSRPLAHVSVEPNSKETLTPNHFFDWNFIKFTTNRQL